MRLVCPQCAAQYEVDINAIPEDGRDVQCANCGNTWFQKRDGHDHATEDVHTHVEEDEPEELEEDVSPTRSLERPQATPVDQSVLDILRQEAELDATARQAVEPDAQEFEQDEIDDVEGTTEDDAEEYAADDAVEDDAETDDDDIADEADDIDDDDTADDLDDDDDDPEEQNLADRARSARSRLTSNRDLSRRLNLSAREEDDDVEEEPSAYSTQDLRPPAPDNQYEDESDLEFTSAPQRPPASERPLRDFPDVDALNSTLRSADDKSREKDKRGKSKRKPKSAGRGNSFGFYFAILVFLILLAAYALKPQIIAALPASAPYLEGYTDIIDIARHRLVDGITNLAKAAQNLLAQYM
ncbi:MAG: putative Zn finger-like uncharacterized protein [Paracoccaceae bacterium]|jgi:predicted Zn finger-like uncharacterized protein